MTEPFGRSKNASTAPVQQNTNENNAEDRGTGRTSLLSMRGNFTPSEPPYNPFPLYTVPSVHSVHRLNTKGKTKDRGGRKKQASVQVTEDKLQAIVNVYLSRFLPSRSLHWATPNDSAGRERAREGARRKQMGRRAGIPDIFVLHDGHLIGLELKRPEGSVTVS